MLAVIPVRTLTGRVAMETVQSHVFVPHSVRPAHVASRVWATWLGDHVGWHLASLKLKKKTFSLHTWKLLALYKSRISWKLKLEKSGGSGGCCFSKVCLNLGFEYSSFSYVVSKWANGYVFTKGVCLSPTSVSGNVLLFGCFICSLCVNSLIVQMVRIGST